MFVYIWEEFAFNLWSWFLIQICWDKDSYIELRTKFGDRTVSKQKLLSGQYQIILNKYYWTINRDRWCNDLNNCIYLNVVSISILLCFNHFHFVGFQPVFFCYVSGHQVHSAWRLVSGTCHQWTHEKNVPPRWVRAIREVISLFEKNPTSLCTEYWEYASLIIQKRISKHV